MSGRVALMIPIKSAEKKLMKLALVAAREAADAGEIPIGAVVVDSAGKVLATARNRQIDESDPTSHAEVLAIREATAALGSRYLERCTLVVTLEPCSMCAGAIALARIPRVLFGAWDEKAGAAGSVYDILRDSRLPHPEIEVAGGVCESESQALLREFFEQRR